MGEFKLTKDQQELIERVGVTFEGMGMAPAPARISALLLVAPQGELPFDAICRLLNMSKSATSTSLSLLQGLNKVEYITKPGERKRYFKVKVNTWREDMKQTLQGMVRMSSVYREILAQRPKDTKDFNNHLADIANFMDHVAKELPTLFNKWERTS